MDERVWLHRFCNFVNSITTFCKKKPGLRIKRIGILTADEIFRAAQLAEIYQLLVKHFVKLIYWLRGELEIEGSNPIKTGVTTPGKGRECGIVNNHTVFRNIRELREPPKNSMRGQVVRI